MLRLSEYWEGKLLAKWMKYADVPYRNFSGCASAAARDESNAPASIAAIQKFVHAPMSCEVRKLADYVRVFVALG